MADSKFTKWLSTFFESDEDIATHHQVAAAQKAELDRQRDEGKRGLAEYFGLSGLIEEGGEFEAKDKDANDDFWKVVPWWGWLLAVGVVFWFLGGFAWALKKSKGALNR